MIKLFKNKRHGFTLMELMIGVGIVGIISLGVLQVTKDTTKIKKSTATSMEGDQASTMVGARLSDPDICTSTLFGKNPKGLGEAVSYVITKENIKDIKIWEGSSKDIDTAEQTQFNSLPIKQVYLRGDCGADPKPCILGQGTEGRLFVKEMKILAYEMTHPDASNDESPYKNGPNQATFEITFVVGAAIGETDQAKLQGLKDRIRGQLEYVRRIPVALALDSNNLITDCVTDLGKYSENFCNQLDGNLDDDKCKGITVRSTNIATIPAVKVLGNMKIKGNEIVEKTLTVGTSPGGPITDGSVNAGGSATINQNLHLKNGRVNMGDLATPQVVLTPAIREIKLADNSGTQGKLNLGSNTYLRGINNYLGIMTINPLHTLDVSGTGHISLSLTVDGDTDIRDNLVVGTNSSNATAGIVGGRLQFSGKDIKIVGGMNDSFNASWRTDSSDRDLIATRDWVYQLFANRLGDAASNQVIDNIIEYSNKQPLDSVVSSFCNRTRYSNGASSPCTISLVGCSGANNNLRGYDGNGAPNCTLWSGIQCPGGTLWDGYNKNIAQPTCTPLTTKIGNTSLITRLRDRQNSCWNYLAAVGYGHSRNWNWQTGYCKGTRNVVEYKNGKGCTAAWDRDSAGDCACWNTKSSSGQDCTYNGSPQCYYNWVVVGKRCACKCDATQNHGRWPNPPGYNFSPP
jgi:prepilin-type N-terminal cleavage/methylation domain-containing protein